MSMGLESLCSAWIKCENNSKVDGLCLEPLPLEDLADGCKPTFIEHESETIISPQSKQFQEKTSKCFDFRWLRE